MYGICFDLQKPLKYLFFSPSAFQNVLSVGFFFQFKAKFDADALLFQSAVFWVCKNREWNNMHLYLTRHYSTVAHAATLFKVGNDSPDSTLSISSSRNLC
jgi:hypothetical protein